MGAGRPREHNREQIAKDLIEWARLPDSINFNKFAAYYEPIFPVKKLREWSLEDPEFRAAYECAKNFLAFRREEMLSKGDLHVKAFDLNATVYDLQHRDEKMDNAIFESSLRKDEEGSKATTINLTVPNDLGAGLNVSAKTLSDKDNQSPKSGD